MKHALVALGVLFLFSMNLPICQSPLYDFVVIWCYKNKTELLGL